MRALPDDIEIYTTGDGSPTLAFKRADGYVEKMHHTGGALSESLYIYRDALKLALENGASPRVISMGLGLGYNELISIAHFAAAGIDRFKIWSFEAVPALREAFAGWAGGDISSQLTEVSGQAAAKVAEAFSITPERLRELTCTALKDGRLELRGPFPDDIEGVTSTSTVYYDAYSNKMDPALWSVDFLTEKLGPCLDEVCVLATYAATGALNRSLKQLGFRLIPKAGFQGKRQSTLALRLPVR